MALAVGDTIVLFSSPNLKTWSFESNFKPIESKDFGVWECPDLFKLNAGSVEKWIMIVNHGDKAPNGGSGTRYFVGNFDGKQFIETQPAKWLDHGTDFYAGVTYANAPDNKRILMGWMSNWQYATKTPTKVWRSAMALPRELALVKQDSDFVLRQKMIPGLTSLMQQQYSNATEKLPFAKTNIPLSQSHITFEVPKAMNDFNIILSNTKDESFVMSYSTKQLTTDRSKSGKTNFSDTFSKLQQMVVDEAIYKVELIVDKSSIEILLNDGIYVMTNKVFPNEDFSSISITSDSGKSIANLKMSRMASVWKK